MAREMNASEEQERESSEWNVRELSAGEFDALSAASEYGWIPADFRDGDFGAI